MWTVDFQQSLHRLFQLRRDVRSFRTDPLPNGALRRWLESACRAPSVGYSQPWRFVSVVSTHLRVQIASEFKEQNQLCSEKYDNPTASEYRLLKLAGLAEAPEHLAVFVQPNPKQGRGLGRETMPETVEYSVVAAIQNLWLAARAEGVGVGWVSIMRPEVIRNALEVPADWKLVAYLCLGYPKKDNETMPELERLGWESKVELDSLWLNR